MRMNKQQNLNFWVMFSFESRSQVTANVLAKFSQSYQLTFAGSNISWSQNITWNVFLNTLVVNLSNVFFVCLQKCLRNAKMF